MINDSSEEFGRAIWFSETAKTVWLAKDDDFCFTQAQKTLEQEEIPTPWRRKSKVGRWKGWSETRFFLAKEKMGILQV